MSGAEYDPERPIDRVINGINRDMSIFDTNSARSKAKNKSHVRIAYKTSFLMQRADFDADIFRATPS